MSPSGEKMKKTFLECILWQSDVDLFVYDAAKALYGGCTRDSVHLVWDLLMQL